MTFLLFLAVVVLAINQRVLWVRTRRLQEEVRELRLAQHRAAEPAPEAAAVVRFAPPRQREWVEAEVEPTPDQVPIVRAEPVEARVTNDTASNTPFDFAQDERVEEDRSHASPPPPPPSPPRPAITFESLVGGKLPIWIGGAALVLSAFFLVRYSIESGLLGPAARTVIAGLFGLALIAASEVARRLPATRDDPRVGQALAGAGTASLYGTLYVATQTYGLIGAATAFPLMVVVTLAALGLALRHGPPTAIMALIGGFVAPLLAGFGESGVGPLIVYLALLIAALFGLAIRRGWAWLALAACGGGFAWANLLIVMFPRGGLAGVGGFVLLLAVGATLALPGTGARRPWLRLLPLVAGFVQLLVLAPALDFSALSWGLYLLLSAAALVLAWRDEALAPGAGAALALVLLLLAAAMLQPAHEAANWAAVAITVLFGVPGFVLMRRSALWAAMGLAAVAVPVVIARAFAPDLLGDAGWCALLLATGVVSAALSWRDRDAASAVVRVRPALTGG
ncbi:DUF2339 domain-containing protein, partial [Sphingomonas immobilis]